MALEARLQGPEERRGRAGRWPFSRQPFPQQEETVVKDKSSRAQRLGFSLSSTEGPPGPSRSPGTQLRSQVCFTGLSGLCKTPAEPPQIPPCAHSFQPPHFPHRPLDFWLICATERVDTLPCVPLFTPQALFLSGACSSAPLHDLIAPIRARGDL